MHLRIFGSLALLVGLMVAPGSPAGAALLCTAYVTNGDGDNVSVIDTATTTVTTSIDVGDAPRAVVVTPDGTTAYVANGRSASVSVIDTATNTVTTTIDTGFNGPWGVAFTPDSATAYVTNDDDASVSVVDTATNTVTDTITVGPFPNAVAIGRCTTPEPGIDAEVTGDGRTVSVSGSGFPADAAVTVALEGVTLGSATADGSGTFTGAFTVADCALTGGTLTATAGDSVAATEVTLLPCGSPGPTPGPNPAPVVPRFTG